MRAREPDHTGYAEQGGVRIAYEVFGDGEPAVLFVPASPITHSREWKAQVPYLARHARVVTYDGRGNGGSDRPTDPAAYADRENIADALAVMDAAGLSQAVLVTHCHSARWGFTLADDHPDRVLGLVAIAPGIPLLTPPHPHWLEADERFEDEDGPYRGWHLYNRHHWLVGGYREWVEFFFDQQLPEPHSTKQHEDAVRWAMETSPEVMLAAEEDVDIRDLAPTSLDAAEALCRRLSCPTMVIHGDRDMCQPVQRGERVAELTGGRLEVLTGSGHQPHGRDPVRVNVVLREFVARVGSARAGSAPGAAAPTATAVQHRWAGWSATVDSQEVTMRAREPDHTGYVEQGGVKIGYEVFGERGPTVLLMPTWTAINSRFWKAQVPYLARHFRVVTYDGPGNGLSDRPAEPAAYEHSAQVGYARAVLDATGTDRAVAATLSMGANWALELAAEHPDRVAGLALIAPTVSLRVGDDPRTPHFAPTAPMPDLPGSAVPSGGEDPVEHWAKYNLEYWQERYEDFLWFFFGQVFAEPHSTKPVEDAVGWGLETGPEVLTAHHHLGAYPGEAMVRQWCERVSAPVLVIHGDADRVSPQARGELLAELTGGEFVAMTGSGHNPAARDPVRVNAVLREFVARVESAPVSLRRGWTRGRSRPRRVLYVSSPIGLGHARRDLAVVQRLRQRCPDVEVEWLAQHPVTRVLETAGERVHPASRWLASESAHVESESAEHDLHAFQAIRDMDEILVANFMVFHDLVEAESYDLVVADEGWELDHFLHENPELKRFAYAWFTDFVGWLPMPDGGDREALVAADYNAEMIEQIARFPRVRDRAIFVGGPEDVVPDSFGPGLPMIRDWTEAHYDFAGYVTGFDPAGVADREALRAELGYRPGEQVCVVTVGGSGVGGDLLRKVIAAFPAARRRVPGLRMVVVTGPRINPAGLPAHDGLEVHAYVPGLYRHLAACDLAIVQGGLTTCMELTASGRPFVYVPLRHHFEQNFHVPHRLGRYGAGVRLDYDRADADHLAELIAGHIGRETDYRPVETDGADRGAALLADLL